MPYALYYGMRHSICAQHNMFSLCISGNCNSIASTDIVRMVLFSSCVYEHTALGTVTLFFNTQKSINQTLKRLTHVNLNIRVSRVASRILHSLDELSQDDVYRISKALIILLRHGSVRNRPALGVESLVRDDGCMSVHEVGSLIPKLDAELILGFVHLSYKQAYLKIQQNSKKRFHHEDNYY